MERVGGSHSRFGQDGQAPSDGFLTALHPRVYSWALWILGDPDDAADATQETLLRVFGSMESYRGEASLDTWAYRITVNCCRTAADRRRHAPTLRLCDCEDLPGGVDPVECLERGEVRRRVAEALNRIRPRYQALIRVCDIEGCSYAEAAERLGLTLGQVKVGLHRARRSFRERYLMMNVSPPPPQTCVGVESVSWMTMAGPRALAPRGPPVPAREEQDNEKELGCVRVHRGRVCRDGDCGLASVRAEAADARGDAGGARRTRAREHPLAREVVQPVR